jgi:tRNA G18 (ribose-2'-O)-methylase SpoU
MGKYTRMVNMRGYFAIGIEHGKTEANIGTLWRSAYLFGAAYIFTIGRRYKKQCSDTQKTWRHIPLFHYETFDEFYSNIPCSCKLIGIEMDDRAIPIKQYEHPQRAIYLLGAEDHGLTSEAMKKCHDIIVLPGEFSMNVSTAGSIVMFDRQNKTADVSA